MAEGFLSYIFFRVILLFSGFYYRVVFCILYFLYFHFAFLDYVVVSLSVLRKGEFAHRKREDSQLCVVLQSEQKATKVQRRIETMLNQSRHLSSLVRRNAARLYSTTPLCLEPDASMPSKETRQQISASYNTRRAAYKKAVGKLRKQYAEEVEKQRISDETEKAKKRAEDTRKRLERQRLKNIRSVKNAMRQEEARVQRAAEFEDELKVAQENREARRERFEKARRLVLQELEEEAPFWLSTEQEVNAALDSAENQQKLWTRPGGFVGAPLPTQDAEFWRYETHTWDMRKNFKTPRDVLLEEIEEMAFEESNIDSSYWNKEKIDAQLELEAKAKLRAMVREEGRKSLLFKQREMMQDIHSQKNNAVGEDGMPAIPTPMPAPSLKILGNYTAMEKEGSKILHENPTNFFLFENDDEMTTTQGRKSDKPLGKPIRLRDKIRDNSPTGTPFPQLLGKLPKPDTRTDREIKRQEREDRLWAAAQEEASSGVEFAADDELEGPGEKADHERLLNIGDEDDEEWAEGLDPIADKELLETPRHERYTDEDIAWVREKLERKIDQLKESINFEQHANLENAALVSDEDENHLVNALSGENVVKEDGVDERGRKYTEYKVVDDDDDDEYALDALIRKQDKTSVLDTLNEQQIAVIQSLDDDGISKTAEGIKAALTKVPGLSNEQVQSLVELEMSLAANDEVKTKVTDRKRRDR